MSVGVILLVVALVLFLLACVNWPQVPVSFGWLGLFFLTLYFLVGRA